MSKSSIVKRVSVSRICRGLAMVGSVFGLCVLTAACGSNRFEGQTEDQMFVTVRDDLCATVKRCPVLWGDGAQPPATAADFAKECEKAFDDPQHYKAVIDDPTRDKLDACLSSLEASSCEELKAAHDLIVPACKDVSKYLDLK